MGLPAATTRIFTGHGQAGNWSDPANWANGQVPGAADTALVQIDATMNGAITVDQAMFLGQETVTINGAIHTLSTNSCASFMVCDHATVTLTATSSVSSAGGIIVGNDSVGTLIADGTPSAHATMNSVYAKIGSKDGGVGTATIDGATWTNTDNMFVGLGGDGTLNILDGGHVATGGAFIVGQSAGVTGHVSLSGGASLTVALNARIGGLSTTAPGGTGFMTVGSGSTFSVGGPLSVASGSILGLAGGTVTSGHTAGVILMAAGSTISGFGSINSEGHEILDSGTITATGGTLVVDGLLTGPGQVQIEAGSTIQLSTALIGVATIAFTGAGGTLSLAHGVTDHATITGFAAGDAVLMAGIDHIGWNSTTDLLTLSESGHVVDTLKFAGIAAGSAFQLTQTNAGAMIGLASSHPSFTGH